jgi:predicted dehydrogenase
MTMRNSINRRQSKSPQTAAVGSVANPVRPSDGLSRRSLIKAAAAGVIVPQIVPASVFSAEAPSNRIAMACIGVGRMGRGDMKECLNNGLKVNARIVAVCDLDSNRAKKAAEEVDAFYAKQAAERTQDRCRAYGDYRELLAREDIDGVTISTPDHWHALCGVAAARAGKDIYIQKPLTFTIAEGRALVEAVRKHGRVLQTGSQQRSSVEFRTACELVRNGRIGKLHTIGVFLPEDHGTGKSDLMSVPANLDYDSWLGPTPKEPYTEHRVHPHTGYGRPGWLQIDTYCRGMITGWGAHMNDTAQWANDADTTGPVEIEASAEFPDRGLFNVHTKFQAEARYANGVRLFMKTGPAGVTLQGDEGKIMVRRGGIESTPSAILKDDVRPDEIQLYRSDNHMLNFLQCMRTRRDPIASVETGHRSNTVCVLAHIAMQLGRKLHWDPVAERFAGDVEANSYLDYTHRKPWTI